MCINNTIPFNKSLHSITLLKSRIGLQLPVTLTRPWEDRPIAGIISNTSPRLLKRTKCFIE